MASTMVKNKLIPGKLYLYQTAVLAVGYPIDGVGPYLIAPGVFLNKQLPIMYIEEHLDPPLSMWNSKVLAGDQILVVCGRRLVRYETI